MLFDSFEAYDVQETRRVSRAEGRAESILEQLEEIGNVPEALGKEILEERDLDTLKRWAKLTLRCGSVEEFLLQYREQIDFDAIPSPSLLRLNKAIWEKYFGEDRRIRPEYRDQKEKWSSLCTTLVKHMD